MKEVIELEQEEKAAGEEPERSADHPERGRQGCGHAGKEYRVFRSGRQPQKTKHEGNAEYIRYTGHGH